MTPTERYIQTLTQLKDGERGLLRTHKGEGLDCSVEGFDLFAGLWWPLRKESPRAPRREVAWLIAKLHAAWPVPHESGKLFACQLRQCAPSQERERIRFRQRIDRLLYLPVQRLEPSLHWAIERIASEDLKLDWVQFTDDLSRWQRATTRIVWAKQYLETKERVSTC